MDARSDTDSCKRSRPRHVLSDGVTKWGAECFAAEMRGVRTTETRLTETGILREGRKGFP